MTKNVKQYVYLMNTLTNILSITVNNMAVVAVFIFIYLDNIYSSVKPSAKYNVGYIDSTYK